MTSTPLGHSIAAPRRPAEVSAALAASTGTPAGWLTPTTLALSALALGLALEVSFGLYHRAAMPWLAFSLAMCVVAATVPNWGRLTFMNWRPDQLVLAVALSVQFSLLYVRDPAATLELGDPEDLVPFKAGVALAAALVAVGVSGTRSARFAVPMLLLSHFALGLWVLRATPAPGIDVYAFQRDACDALLKGLNPYATTFPHAHGAGMAESGRLNIGYPCLPLTLLLALPGHLLGDFRIAQLLAMTLAGALIAYARPGEPKERQSQNKGLPIAAPKTPAKAGGKPLLAVAPLPFRSVSSQSFPGARCVAAAALLLFTPRGFFVLEAGWTEPFAILLLAATVFAACRRGRAWSAAAAAVAFGLLLASQPYLILALPLVLLLPIPREPRRLGAFFAVAFAVAAAVTLPLALWDLKAFVHSAVTLPFQQPFRSDALSYLVPLRATGTHLPAWAPFACAGVAGLMALWRCPRSAAGFALAVALVLFMFFASSNRAFCNDYVLILAALCTALAATPGLPSAKPHRP